MEADEEHFKEEKIRLKNDIKNYFKKIEKELGEPLPKDFLDLVYGLFEGMYPLSKEEALEFYKQFPEFYQIMIDFFESYGANLNPICKKLIDRLVIDLFLVTDRKGIGTQFWLHFPLIWHYNRVIEKMNPSKEMVETDFFILMSMYGSLHELTLKFLTDFALIIARKTKKNRASQTLINQHSRAIQKDKSISRFDLLQFLRKKNYLVGGKCDVLEDTVFRDKAAHADAYIDQNKKFVIGKVRYEKDDFSKIYQKMLEFYCYMLFSYLREAGVTDRIFQYKEIIEKGSNLPKEE